MPNIARDCDFAQKAGNNADRCIIYVQLAGCCFSSFPCLSLRQSYEFNLKSDGYAFFLTVLNLGKLFADVYWQLGSKLIYW